MKVTELKTVVVEREEPSIGGRYSLFLELLRDEGIVGPSTPRAATKGARC